LSAARGLSYKARDAASDGLMPDSGHSPDLERASPLAQLRTALAFLTRLPVGTPPDLPLARAGWAFPLVGALIGAIGGGVYLCAEFVGLAGSTAALLAIGATVLATGALHEDGLADTADGLGARGDAARRLAVMRDSRIGTYGALALVFAIALKVAALGQTMGERPAAMMIFAAAVISRAVLPAIMATVRPARPDGLSRAAGTPSVLHVVLAAAFGAAIPFAVLDPVDAVVAIAAGAIAAALITRLCAGAFGGQTGDTLGAAQQAAEVAAMLAIAAAGAW
jgi:adenosylcobinamide-GDP ribazoletransferase